MTNNEKFDAAATCENRPLADAVFDRVVIDSGNIATKPFELEPWRHADDMILDDNVVLGQQ